MSGEDWTFWLMMMNYALGVIVLATFLVLLGAVSWELLAKRAQKARVMGSMDEELKAMLQAESHRMSVPGLGMTMADGGESVGTPQAESWQEESRRK
jgi:hypothetical protein